jgi:hypothetical protein
MKSVGRPTEEAQRFQIEKVSRHRGLEIPPIVFQNIINKRDLDKVRA